MGVLNDLVVGALSNGVNPSTLVLLNVVLVGVFGSLLLLLGSSISNNPALLPHVVVLLLLAVGLTVSINWFVLNIGLVNPKDQKVHASVLSTHQQHLQHTHATQPQVFGIDEDTSGSVLPGSAAEEDDEDEPKKVKQRLKKA
jgi:hypothetical protein